MAKNKKKYKYIYIYIYNKYINSGFILLCMHMHKLHKSSSPPKILKIILNFDNFFSFVTKMYDRRHLLTVKFLTIGTHLTSFLCLGAY